MFKPSRLKVALTVILLLAVCLAQQRTMTLSAAVDAGLVTADMQGTGGSSGASVTVTVSKTPRAGSGPLSLGVPPGTRLASSDSASQSMVVAGILGRMIDDERYEPVSRIFLSESTPRDPGMRQPRGGGAVPVSFRTGKAEPSLAPAARSGVYILEAYCTEFEKDNPSGSTGFSFGSVDRNLACILKKASSIQSKQAAV